jgi:ribosomal protein L40E
LGVLSKPVCAICGAKNLPGTKFCVSCGAPLPRNEETHDEVDIMELRKAKLGLDLMIKERMKGADKEISEKRAKLQEEEERSMREIEDYRAKTNDELTKQAEMLDAYREKVNEMGSEDVAKLRKVTAGLKDVVGYYANPYSEIDEELIEEETYVCPICGAINPLTVTECLHCGRNRARASQLLAKGKITQAAPVRYGATILPVQDVDLDAPHTPTFDEFAGEAFEEAQTKPIELEREQPEQPAPAPEQAYYGAPYGAPYGYPYGAAVPHGQYQMPPIVQPVAFVPYVTQDQPLMQYTPADNAGRPTNN